jgi:lauroyl/myristoyl acyltransferase
LDFYEPTARESEEDLKELRVRLLAGMAFLVAVTAVGTIGFKIIDHRPFLTFEILRRALASGGIVGMLGDAMRGSDVIELPFLGATMAFPAGPARLAAATGAPIVPAFAVPLGPDRHMVQIHPPLVVDRNEPEAVEACMRSYVTLLDGIIRRHPGVWWFWHRLKVEQTDDGGRLLRWRPRPDV